MMKNVAVSIEEPQVSRTSDLSRPTLYAWLVFALTIGLMVSDYLSRQVISPAFVFIKHDWSLSDAQLGGLVSIVSLATGLFAVPISMLSDRFGRVKSIVAMAILWSLATIACGLTGQYSQLFASRALVGLGEAGYGGAGGALLAHVFPARLRSTVFGLFLAGALLGSVLGVLIGGIVSVHFSWRIAFFVVAAPGLVLAVLYGFFVRDYPTIKVVKTDARGHQAHESIRWSEMLRHVFPNRSSVYTYLASGFQYMITGVMIAWMPSYLIRYYAVNPQRAASLTAAIVVVMGVGMFLGGRITDALSQHNPKNKGLLPAVYCLASAVILCTAFSLPPGAVGLALLFVGAMFVGGHSGVGPAIVTEVTNPAIRATAIATIVLADNLLGLAPGPVLVGAISDHSSLRFALEIVPIASIVGAFFYMLASRSYAKDRAAFHDHPAVVAPAVL
jgi:MFS family permease